MQHCQTVYNKKIFVSVGGSAGGVIFKGDADAVGSARILWNVLGAGTDTLSWRPLGDVIADGFDIGIATISFILDGYWLKLMIL